MYTRIEKLIKWIGGWQESGFSLLEWDVTGKQREEVRMIFVIMD